MGSNRKWRDRKRPCPEPEEVLSGTGSMLCVCATGNFVIPLVRLFTGSDVSDRKRAWLEVIVWACSTGSFCITTRVVAQVPWLPVTEGHPKGWNGVRMPNRKLRNIPLVGPFHRKLAIGSDVIFPRILLCSSTKCWLGVFSTTSVSTPFPGYLPLLFS